MDMNALTTELPPFQFVLQFHENAEGPPIFEDPVGAAELQRAQLVACYEAVRQDRLPPAEALPDRVVIVPDFLEPEAGSPRARGFHAVLGLPGGDEVRTEFDSTYFANRARRVAADLLRQGRRTEGESLFYRLTAVITERPAATKRSYLIEPEPLQLTIRENDPAALGSAEPWDEPEADQLPVYVSRSVIEAATEEAGRDTENEVGGILLGHHLRSPQTRTLALHVTALLPAERTEATSTSITFKPETFARARRVMELRGEGEGIVGWFHSHPFRFCAECPLPAPRECIDKVLTYSNDDHFVMESTFPQPFMIGLLAGIEPRLEAALGHAPVRLYGWRRGVLQRRGFHVVAH